MRRKGKIWIFVVAAVILFFAGTTFFGASTKLGDIEKPIVKSVSDIRFGIDIRGGVEVTFVPALEEAIQATETQMSAAQAVIEQRLVNLGINDYEIYKDVEKGRIILRFPWKEDETEFNPETAIEELSAAAVLTFREGYEVDDYGAPTGVTEENIILQGTDVEKAEAKYTTSSTGSGEYVVQLTLSTEGATKFSEATERLAAESGSISIWMDDTVISNPSVNDHITGNTAVISGSFTAETATDLADKINAGSLPFALQAESYSTISPTLGARSLQAMVIAGIVAFILIVCFMIFKYRLPGVVASLSLLGQVALTLAFVSGYFSVLPSQTLTLPGIAGIILAIGMGVDANVITSERIREELRSGKKLDASIRAGFQRGLAPVIDGNVTVMIVAVILMGAFGPSDGFFATLLSPVFRWFGAATTGSIYSFGYTLLVGVLANFIFGILATRVSIFSLSRFKTFRSPWLYGGLKQGQVAKVDKPFNIVGSRRKFFGLSGVILVVIIVATFAMGVQMDVQFKGGAIISYSYTGDLDLDAAKPVIDEALGADVTLQTGSAVSSSTSYGVETYNLTITLPGSETVSTESMEGLTAILAETYPDNNFEQLEVNNVDVTMGRDFLLKCLVALLLAIVLILVYVAFRFRRIGGWRGGITAIVALVHDLIVVYGVFVICGIPLSGNFVAVLLTILGYSINDTVVIYDRVRENRGLYGKRMSFSDTVNLSINQSLNRSIITSVTTVMALACVCVFALVYGLPSIFQFAFPLAIGMVSGVYSTICIAGPLWVMWENRRIKQKKLGSKKVEGKNAKASLETADEKDEKDIAAKKDDKTSKTAAKEKAEKDSPKKASVKPKKNDEADADKDEDKGTKEDAKASKAVAKDKDEPEKEEKTEKTTRKKAPVKPKATGKADTDEDEESEDTSDDTNEDAEDVKDEKKES